MHVSFVFILLQLYWFITSRTIIEINKRHKQGERLVRVVTDEQNRSKEEGKCINGSAHYKTHLYKALQGHK